MIDMTEWQKMAARCVRKRLEAPGRLKGKIAIVTGAAQGFGLGIAQAIWREGACVVLADLRGDAVAREAERLGERAAGLRVDVSDEMSVAELVAGCVEAFGGLDLMVSNAGIVRSGSLETLEKTDLEQVTAVNYTGFYLCARYAAAVMKAQREADPQWTGDIVTINSKSGLTGSNRNFAYAGSKFGAIGLVQSFALELCSDGIKVNAVCPGNYLDGPLWSDPETGLFLQYLKAGKVPGARSIEDVRRAYEAKVPMGRGCTPEDVARAVFYAVEQQYETGQAIPVTGGQVMLS